MSKPILKADLEGTATLALTANHANAADNATNATHAVSADTATNATNATKAVKLEENSATGAFRYDLGNGLIMVVFNETLQAGANTPSNCSIQVAEFPNKILFAIPTIVDSTAHAAFVGYDIMGKYTIKLWVGSTAEDMSRNRTFKVRCVVVGY